MSDYEEELERRLDETFAPPWRPTEGDLIMGVVERTDTAPGKDWGPYPVVTVRAFRGTQEGKPLARMERLAIHGMHTALRGSWDRDYPERDDVISVRYSGLKTNPRTGRTFESYDYTRDPHPPAELVEEAHNAARTEERATSEPF